jgi:hypothetical protein
MSDMDVNDYRPGVLYRPGRPSREDYEESIADLRDAMTQLAPDGDNCAVCHDSGHQAWECHHNPLVMARKAVALESAWRCFHCDAVFTDEDAARAHFGRNEFEDAACQRGHGEGSR